MAEYRRLQGAATEVVTLTDLIARYNALCSSQRGLAELGAPPRDQSARSTRNDENRGVSPGLRAHLLAWQYSTTSPSVSAARHVRAYIMCRGDLLLGPGAG